MCHGNLTVRKTQAVAAWMAAVVMLFAFGMLLFLLSPINEDAVTFLLAVGIVISGMCVMGGIFACLGSMCQRTQTKRKYIAVRSDEPSAGLQFEQVDVLDAIELEKAQNERIEFDANHAASAASRAQMVRLSDLAAVLHAHTPAGAARPQKQPQPARSVTPTLKQQKLHPVQAAALPASQPAPIVQQQQQPEPQHLVVVQADAEAAAQV